MYKFKPQKLFQIQIQIQKNFIATQKLIFYIQTQCMVQYIFWSKTSPATNIFFIVQVSIS